MSIKVERAMRPHACLHGWDIWCGDCHDQLEGLASLRVENEKLRAELHKKSDEVGDLQDRLAHVGIRCPHCHQHNGPLSYAIGLDGGWCWRCRYESMAKYQRETNNMLARTMHDAEYYAASARAWEEKAMEVQGKLAQAEKELESARKANAEMNDVLRCLQAAVVGQANGIENDLKKQMFRATAMLSEFAEPGRDYVHRSEVERVREETIERCAKVAESGSFLHEEAPDARLGRAVARAIRALGEKKAGG